MAVLNKQLWSSTITEQLLASNSFLATWKNYSQYVDNQYVNIPVQPDWKTNSSPIHINPASYNFLSSFNTSAYQVNQIAMTNLIAEPLTLSSPVEEYEFAFDKRANLTAYSSELLKMTIDDLSLVQLGTWTGVSAQTYATTGSKRAAYNSYQSGNRLAISQQDLLNIRYLFDSQDIPLEGRKIIIPAELESDIFALGGANGPFVPFYLLTDNKGSIRTPGTIGAIYGFDVIVRSRVLLTSSGSTTGTTGTVINTSGVNPGNRIDLLATGTTQTSANMALIAYSEALVGRAYGPVDIFSLVDSPYAYGTVISYYTRYSAFNIFNSNKGIAVLGEANA